MPRGTLKSICTGFALAVLAFGFVGTYILECLWSPLPAPMPAAPAHPSFVTSWEYQTLLLTHALPAIALWNIADGLFMLFSLLALYLAGYSRGQRRLAFITTLISLSAAGYIMFEQSSVVTLIVLCVSYGGYLYGAWRLVLHRPLVA